jgi:uncharacterized repeat protein (TIGR01451 family)
LPFALVSLWILLAGGAQPVQAAPPPPGTVIDSQATVNYYNPALGQYETVTSNTVRVIVQPVEALTLVADQQIQGTPGSPVSFAHILTNTGNTPLSCLLDSAALASGAFVLSGVTIVRDLNGNGQSDSGEPVIPPGGLLPLSTGESVSLVVNAVVPVTVQPGQSSGLTLTAITTVQGARATVIDQVTAVSGPQLKVSKAASSGNPVQGEEVAFTISTINIGIGPAAGVSAPGGEQLLVDGVQQQLVLLRDRIPANTGYVPGSLALQGSGRLLYHGAGDPPSSYRSVEPAVVDEVACGLNSLDSGRMAAFVFRIRINDNAAGTITNTAGAFYANAIGQQPLEVRSNTIVFNLPLLPPVISFYSNDSFSKQASATHLGNPLFVQAGAAQCNSDPLAAEEHPITISSALTGDVESYTAVETGPNTGVFRILASVPTLDAATHPVISGNASIETRQRDVLNAAISACGGGEARAKLLVDPGGVVFDSRGNSALAGATVTLIDTTGAGNGGAANSPAKVFDVDGVTPLPSTIVTGPDGAFQFPYVLPSSYLLSVSPPNGWTFPSTLTPLQLPAGRTIDQNGSYGLAFPVNASTGPVQLDVPLDPGTAGGLFVQKSASRTTAEIADFITYTVKVKNSSGTTLQDVVLRDIIPFGFVYQKGTARRDGLAAADPEGGSGPRLVFRIGELTDGSVVQVSYRLRVGPGALRGDGINRAQATAASGTVSNVASVAVALQQGVFTDKGVIIGKIFMDCNRDKVQGDKEPGIPGVRIYLEDGTYILTDSEGKYSFYGLTPRTHILKVDETTLPRGAELEVLSNRHAGDGSSMFADLKGGELLKADFAEGSCTPELLTQVKLRRLKGDAFVPETNRGMNSRLTLEQTAPQPSDVKSRPASGLVGGETKLPFFSPMLAVDEPRKGDSPPAEPVAQARLQDYGESLAKMDSGPGFIDLREGDVLPTAQATVRVKGSSGGPLKLLVNGQEIQESRIGKRVLVEERKLEAREYIGVGFNPGPNRLELVQYDGFGNIRGTAGIVVTAPDALARIVIDTPRGDVTADGMTPVSIRVRLTDAKNVPVTARTPVTLETSLGRWDLRDLSEQEPGVQTFIADGQAEFRLFPPAEAGNAVIKVASGAIKAQETVSFVPDLRPLIAVGVIEGTLNLRKLKPGALVAADNRDGFDKELSTFSVETDDKRVSAAGRAAFFLKGKIKGDYLLTMAYDSDKETNERLFRDIQPDQFYPVYGDSSIRGFDAQSTSRFYVRVDKNRSYLMYGDFTTQTSAEVRTLGAYNRSLTGVRGHYENPFISANVFASKDTSRQVVDEIPAQGVSGPYYLSRSGMVVNSEKVEIITRDRNQPALVLNTVPKTRFSDYELEELTGRILFKEPISSRDSSLNPNFIRVTYEVDQGGNDFWVAGGDAQIRLHDRVEVGGGYVRDENPLDRTELGSVNATVKLAEKTFLLGEWAHISRLDTGSGEGMRFELRHESQSLNARVYGYKTDSGFDNPSSSIPKGRTELGAKLRFTLTRNTALTADAIFSEDSTTGGKRQGVLVNLEHSLNRFLKAELGVRYAKESAIPSQTMGDATLTPTENTSIRTKLSAQLPFFPKVSLFGEYEQAVQNLDRRVAALGGDYQVTASSRIYARHEFISSLDGEYSLNSSQHKNTTLVGIDSDYMKDGHIFSEYRIRDSIAGRDSEAAVGLRNGWEITPGIRLNTNIERITTFGGLTDNTSTALAGGLEYTGSDRWKGSTRLEYRSGASSSGYLGTMGVAWKYNRTLTLLGRQIISYTENSGIGGSGTKVQERAQLGFAYRPVDSNRWNLLSKYEFVYESDDTNPLVPISRSVHILSANLNYQPTRALVLSGRYAAKLAREEDGGISSSASAHMVNGRVTYDLTKKWDLGFNAMTLCSGDLRSCSYGLGNEVGYLLSANLWLSAGYNFFGFYDKDLTGEDYTNPGFFMRMRFKFDEHLLDGSRN